MNCNNNLKKKYFLSFTFACTAPGTYDVEKSEKILQHTTGAATFGIKYKDQKPDDIPGI